ncbi:MAG: arginine--tRNA ligase [Brevinema sp.]
MQNLSPKNQIRNILQKALNQLAIEVELIVVEYPENPEHGHYSSPIALGLAKTLKKNPRIIAEEIAQKISQEPIFAKVEIASPGFLNFFMSDTYLSSKLQEILTKEHFGQNKSLSEQHILLEYISANPTGPLHIGHGRWAVVGDSLARLLKFSGADVFREFYVNDAGVQIAHLTASVVAIQEGLAVPEDGYQGSYVHQLAHEVSSSGIAPEVLMQESQRQTLEKFRVEFDRWFSEKTLHQGEIMEQTFTELNKKNATYTKDDALWFRSTEYGKDDKDRVLIKSDGDFTYFASDIAYHRDKIRRGFPILINILGFDHHGYVERISAAVQVLGGELTVLLGQMVNLFRNGEPIRMSKRTGDMISLDEVIEEIGTDAARYLLLRRPMNSSVDFDLETAKTSSDDNPVFYVQYAYARISSILKKSNKQSLFSQFNHEQERILILEMIKFEDLILELSKSYDLHKLPSYLEELAGKFHRFYRACRIIGEEEEGSRLVLCHAAKKVFMIGLNLLGVSAPEKMDSKNAS